MLCYDNTCFLWKTRTGIKTAACTVNASGCILKRVVPVCVGSVYAQHGDSYKVT